MTADFQRYFCGGSVGGRTALGGEIMDENEITTVADTQAEKTADTADTGQTTPTTEELIQQLTARVQLLKK